MNATTTEQNEMPQSSDRRELANTNDWAHTQAAEQAARRAESDRKAKAYWDWVVS